ncbi:MAG: pitrilysin family protein, partial [Bacteroidales bacterium]|nr:pitrilysin family protein [Bacteroidales bacterium]
MKIGTAAGSLRYAVLKSGGRVAYCALSISGGTSAEGSRPCGTAHFLEHTLFKGTDRHNASWVAGRLDQLGGELNAYTAKEEIVLHATVLKEDLRTALDLLLELATCPSFPQKEIDVERGVVIDEIRSGKDVPQDEIYDEFEELFFESHPLSRRILGTASSVRSITREDLCSFVRDNFRPDRMAITVVSGQEEDYAEALILKLAQKYFSTPVPGISAEAKLAPSAGFAPSASVSVFSKTVSRRYHEACIVIGAQAPSLFSGKERTVAALLANILGGPATNSLLNLYLREKKGWVYGIECSYTQYSSIGVMAILIGCE